MQIKELTPGEWERLVRGFPVVSFEKTFRAINERRISPSICHEFRRKLADMANALASHERDITLHLTSPTWDQESPEAVYQCIQAKLGVQTRPRAVDNFLILYQKLVEACRQLAIGKFCREHCIQFELGSRVLQPLSIWHHEIQSTQGQERLYERLYELDCLWCDLNLAIIQINMELTE